jgi:hypothetical protein
MEERDRTCEDDDGGRRGTFTMGLQRRGGCANPSQSGVSREGDAVEEEKTRSGWRSSPVPAKTTMGEERERRRRGGCARTLAK